MASGKDTSAKLRKAVAALLEADDDAVLPYRIAGELRWWLREATKAAERAAHPPPRRWRVTNESEVPVERAGHIFEPWVTVIVDAKPTVVGELTACRYLDAVPAKKGEEAPPRPELPEPDIRVYQYPEGPGFRRELPIADLQRYAIDLDLSPEGSKRELYERISEHIGALAKG